MALYSRSDRHCQTAMNVRVWPDEGAHSAASKIANIAQLSDNPDVVPYVNAFVSMCLFVAVRYLVVAKALHFTLDISPDEILGIKRALRQVGLVFPVAGILFSRRS